MLLVCFKLARDLGCTVGDLLQRMTWVELLHWIAYYCREADMALPPEQRPIRPRTREDAAKTLDRLFGGVSKPERLP